MLSPHPQPMSPLRIAYISTTLLQRPLCGDPTRSAPPPSAELPIMEGSDAPSGQTTPQHAEADCTFAGALVPSDCLPSESTKKAANNLQNALQKQTNDGLEVESFLAGLGLDRYVSLFMEHGFDCLEVVKKIGSQ